MKISIIILTHNALGYVEETLLTLGDITDPAMKRDCEVVVLDNASEPETRDLLTKLKDKGYIDKLHFSEVNTFFAKGNNLAADMSDDESDYVLLLNSDVRINDPDWLRKLIEIKREGSYAAASYGCCGKPARADGYCFLIDRALYLHYRLDEDFPWWGGITKLQYELLRDGYKIAAVDDHDQIIYHYGGKSGKDFKNAGTLDRRYSEIMDSLSRTGGVDVMSAGSGQGLIGTIRKKMRKVINVIKRA